MIEVKVGSKEIFYLELRNEGVFIDGELISCELVKVAERKMKIFKDDRIYDAEISKILDTKMLLNIDGTDLQVEVNDHVHQMLKKPGMGATSDAVVKDIKAPMPGTILNIIVGNGTDVSKGDQLLILEAMKMENVIKSPTDGIVGEIYVSQNESVEKNQVLLSFQ